MAHNKQTHTNNPIKHTFLYSVSLKKYQVIENIQEALIESSKAKFDRAELLIVAYRLFSGFRQTVQASS